MIFRSLLPVCGVRGRSDRIVGGREAIPHNFPWLVGLYTQEKLYCGATVISRSHLLTAAHCVDGIESSEIRVFLGGHNLTSDYTEQRRVRKIMQHEYFDIFTFNNDIAIIEMDKPVKYGPTIQPACLPDPCKLPFIVEVQAYFPLKDSHFSCNRLYRIPHYYCRVGKNC